VMIKTIDQDPSPDALPTAGEVRRVAVVGAVQGHFG
jgi:hypothetical protein